MNTIKLTSILIHTTAEGKRLMFTYSVINENGDILEENVKGSTILLDNNKAELEAISTLETTIKERLNRKE